MYLLCILDLGFVCEVLLSSAVDGPIQIFTVVVIYWHSSEICQLLLVVTFARQAAVASVLLLVCL